MTEPSLGRAILFSILAAVCFAVVRYLKPPEAWSFLLTTLGMIFVGAALFYSLDWLMMHIGEWREAWRRADAVSERVRILDYLSHLTPMQLEALNQYVPVVNILGGTPAPVFQLKTPGGDIPWTFITDTFLPQCNDVYLAPVSSWSEGSHDRIYAEALTRYFITLGFAGEAIGNKPAKWLNKDAAMKWIGLDDAD